MAFDVNVSIIIPVKDEAENIRELAAELSAVLDGCSWQWECIWVNDGSTDGTQEVLERVVRDDPRHRFLTFESNAGQSAAFWAGFREARGAILATLDGDGQNDPSDIPGLVRMVMDGHVDMANGYRVRRKDSLLRKVASVVANGFRNAVTGRTVRDVGCSCRAFRRECVECLPRFAGMHRFLPTLAGLEGFRLGEFPVRHRPRLRGKTKYGINDRLWVGLLDTMGVWWLRKRAFRYRVVRRSGEGGHSGASERIPCPRVSP
ncbi:MAG: glycosyltransferase family 2 protein [Deltaproteobacteria bacterium]|nr:glycosyltransferase family 2 protein [Deltaproteobacteria bacterium]